MVEAERRELIKSTIAKAIGPVKLWSNGMYVVHGKIEQGAWATVGARDRESMARLIYDELQKNDLLKHGVTADKIVETVMEGRPPASATTTQAAAELPDKFFALLLEAGVLVI